MHGCFAASMSAPNVRDLPAVAVWHAVYVFYSPKLQPLQCETSARTKLVALDSSRITGCGGGAVGFVAGKPAGGPLVASRLPIAGWPVWYRTAGGSLSLRPGLRKCNLACMTPDWSMAIWWFLVVPLVPLMI